MSEVSSIARCSDGVLRPAEEHGGLGGVERPRPIVEHLWNTNVVDGRGPLVIESLRRCYAARMISLGW